MGKYLDISYNWPININSVSIRNNENHFFKINLYVYLQYNVPHDLIINLRHKMVFLDHSFLKVFGRKILPFGSFWPAQDSRKSSLELLNLSQLCSIMHHHGIRIKSRYFGLAQKINQNQIWNTLILQLFYLSSIVTTDTSQFSSIIIKLKICFAKLSSISQYYISKCKDQPKGFNIKKI